MSKQHVLIIDDNPEIRSLIHATLGDGFYNIGEAANGEQAFDYLDNHDLPDIVILDLAMPGISGFDVLSEIKNNPETAHIQVIVLSANASQQTIDQSITMGARTVLAKPFSPLELLQLIENVMG
jgi:two-component system, OmpR family, phosphate regulon response regulator PhoB